MTNVSKIIYDLISKKMSTAFIFSGGAIMPLINHLHPKNNINKMKYFVPSSEASAGFCSIGHNKSMNRCDSVVICTSGPAVTNLLTPLADAYCDRIPFLMITGDVSLKARGTRSFQEVPSLELTKPITYWNYSLDDESETHSVYAHAFELVDLGKQVHINIPKDILNKEITKSKKINYVLPKNYIYNIDSIKHIANIINNSIKPILYVGKGCNNASNELLKLATKGNIPVTTTLHGLGVFDENNELSLKMIGMHGSERANNAIQLADCIICIGARFDDRTVGNVDKYAPNAKYIIHINNDESVFNKVIKNTINICGNSKYVLNDLLQFINKKYTNDWINELKLYNITFPYDSIELKQQDVITIFNDLLMSKKDIKKKSMITTGVGNHQMWAAQLITHKYPNRFITSGSLGTMGSSNSMAIGCKIAYPDRYIFAFDGDGSFSMLNDMQMILSYEIGIKIFLLNDSKLSMVNVWEKLFYDNNIVATELKNPDYEYLTTAYNIKYLSVNKTMTKLQITEIINEFIEYDNSKPIFLNCIVDSDFCFPLVAPGSALNDMITYHNFNKYKINKSDAPS
jgi:acetolactate synthase-1/2/3 large subunit